MKKIFSYAALLIIGIAIGGTVIYATTQFIISNDAQNDAQNAAYSQYGVGQSYQAYLKIPGIEGSSVTIGDVHSDEISVIDFGWLETQTGSTGGSSGLVTMEDFEIVFIMDPKASPELFLACAEGTALESAILTVTSIPGYYGSGTIDIMRVTFNDILISSFQTLGDTTTYFRQPLDTITIKCSKIQVEYSQISEERALGMIGAYWDLPTRTGGMLP